MYYEATLHIAPKRRRNEMVSFTGSATSRDTAKDDAWRKAEDYFGLSRPDLQCHGTEINQIDGDLPHDGVIDH